MHSNRVSIIVGLTIFAIGLLLLSVYASTQKNLTLGSPLSVFRYVKAASRHWWKNKTKVNIETDARIWYQYDFEQGKGDWALGQGVALSTKYSHSGGYSVVSNGEGESGRYAEILLDMIPRDARTVVDVVWVYHDGENTSPKNGGTHHISSWASMPGISNWCGPHAVTSSGNELGFYPFVMMNSWSGMKMKPNIWYRIKVVMDMYNSSFDLYILEDGKPESCEIKAIERGIFTNAIRFPMLLYRRFGAWQSPGADAYFDDYSIGYEAPPIKAVNPDGKPASASGGVNTEN